MGIVFLQIAFIWCAIIWVSFLTLRRDGRAPIDDLGVFWLLVLGVYSTIPPLSWLVQGGAYDPPSARLFLLQPTPAEVIALGNIALGYIVGFVTVYAYLLRAVPKPTAMGLPTVTVKKMVGATVIVVLASLIGIYIGGAGLLRVAESYTDSYMVIAELPLGWRQFIKILGGFSSVSTLVLLVGLLQRWPRYRFLFFLYLLSVVSAINPEGSRAGFAIGFLGVIVAWHTLVRPIPLSILLLGGVMGLVSFSILGYWRGNQSLPALDGIGLISIGGGGEFDFLWGNAIDLLQAKQGEGFVVPWTTRFSEFFSFIPNQLLWFEKTSLSVWFLDHFYPEYKAVGGGMAFGVLSQAILGGGVLEALMRGAVLGFIMGKLMRWFRTPSQVWWKFPFHLYLLVWCFQGVRDTTFSLWGGVVQTVLPAFLSIAAIGGLMPQRKKEGLP